MNFIDAPPLRLVPPGLLRGLALLASCALAISPTRAPAAPPHYRVVDLGSLPDSSVTLAYSINASGQIAGSSDNRAIRWTGTVPETLALAPGAQETDVSVGRSINDSGQVTGQSQVSGDAGGYVHAIRWTGTSAEDLGPAGAPNTTGLGINATGQVAGYSIDRGDSHAVRWTDTTAERLEAPSGQYGYGASINASGQVCGYLNTIDGGPGQFTHAARWTGTMVEDLGTLGAGHPWSYGCCINASGQVAGYSIDQSGVSHAVLWTGTVIQDLGNLGGTSSAAAGINTQGDIVGSYSRGHFLYTGGTMFDLESLLEPGSGATSLLLQQGNNINDAGQIAASGIINGAYHALRLDPVAGGGSTDSLSPPTDFTLQTSSPPTKGQDFHFQARQDTTAPGATMRVQASADGTAWTNVPGGTLVRTGSVLWDGHATEIPVGSAFYRAVISAPNYTDGVSTPPATSSPVVAGQPQLVIYEEAFDAAGQPTAVVAAGGKITYKITVVNRGTQIAKKLQVKTIIPDSSFSASATSHDYLPAQFSSRDVTPSLGGKIYTSDQTDANGHPLTGIRWDGFGDLKPGFQQYVQYTVNVPALVKVPGIIGSENRYSVSSQASPAQPAGTFDSSTSPKPLLNSDVRLPISITAVSVPGSETVPPGGLLRYDFTISNLASTARSGAVAVIDIPDFTRLAGYYDQHLKVQKYPAGLRASVVHHQSGPDQILVVVGNLNARGLPNSSQTIRLALQVQYIDPLKIPGRQIETLDYAAAFLSSVAPPPLDRYHPRLFSPFALFAYEELDPTGQYLALLQRIDPSFALASGIDFLAFLSDTAHSTAYTLNESGILKTTVSGVPSGGPQLSFLKSIGQDPANAADTPESEDEGDGTSMSISRQGQPVTYILAAMNTGPTPAEGVRLQDTVPLGMEVSASDLVAGAPDSTGTRLLRAGFIRVVSRTPSSAGLVLTAELGADRVIRISGLRVLPHDNVVVSYTIRVASSGPNAPAPETVIHQFRASITSESLGITEGQLSLNDDLELKIKGVAVFAAPQLLPAGVIPVVTHDLPGSKAALDAIFRRTPNARPVLAGTNPPRVVDGFYRYYVRYDNTGDGAATAVSLKVPVPANATLYRTAFIGQYPDGSKVIDPRHVGNSYNEVNGVPTFTFSRINAHTTGYVMMEVILGAGSVDKDGSHFTLPAASIEGSSFVRSAARAEVSGRETKDSGVPQLAGSIGLPGMYSTYDRQNVPRIGVMKIMPQYVRVGETYTIQIVVMNGGDVDASIASVRMSMPPHSEFVSVDATGGYYAPENLVTATLAGNNRPLPPGGNPENLRALRAHEAAGATFTFRATEGGSFTEATALASVDYVDAIVTSPATLTILGPTERNPTPAALSTMITGLQAVNLPHQLANVIALGGGNVVSQGGGNVVSQGGGNVVSQGGGNVVSQGGGNIVVFGAGSSIRVDPGSGLIPTSSLLQPANLSGLLKSGSANLLVPPASNLIGEDGGSLIGNDGGGLLAGGFASLISSAKSLVVSQGGGNVVSQGGGNVVSQGGGNVVSQGGGNVVSQGGGNIVVLGGAGIVGQGGGNISSLPNSVGLIGQDGGGLVGSAPSGIISQGGGNIISQGGGN